MQPDEDLMRLIGETTAIGAAESGLPGQRERVMTEVGMPRGYQRRRTHRCSREQSEHESKRSGEPGAAAGALHWRDSRRELGPPI